MANFKVCSLFLVGIALLTSINAASSDSPSKPVESRPAVGADKNVAINNYGKMPLHFEINKGQSDKRVRFLARGQGYQLFLEPTVATLSLRSAKPAEPKAEEWMPGQARHDNKTGNGCQVKPGMTNSHEKGKRQAEKQTYSTLRMKLVGANAKAKAKGVDKMPGVSNYLIGNDKSKWHTGIANYAKVQFDSVYPGIDLVYYGNQRQLEHDFVVAPGADPKKIRLSFDGAKGLSISDKGELAVESTDGSKIQLTRPVVYQNIKGKKITIKGSYALLGKKRDQVGFKLASYDKRHALIIDPVLLYASYLGGGNDDGGNAIAIDSSGFAYITGTTFSSNFPTKNAYNSTFDGAHSMAFVAKFNPSASGNSSLIYSTYLGGDTGPVSSPAADNSGQGIAVNGAGQAYVTGYTDATDFPTMNARQSSNVNGVFIAFVTVFDASGTSLVYSTYLGTTASNDQSFGRAIAVDASGFAYVTGTTDASDFPTTAGASQQNLGTGGPNAFVAKFDPTQSGTASLIYCTYLGGNSFTAAFGIAVDAAGSAYVAGFATSNLPTTANAYQPGYGGSEDAFVARLNSLGTQLLYLSYLGGSQTDIAFAIDIDGLGHVFLTGETHSPSTGANPFPITTGAFQSTNQGNGDAFVTKLNTLVSGPAALVYSTFLGGGDNDGGASIKVDSSGGAVITGATQSGSPAFPTTHDHYVFIGTPGVEYDTFITRLNAYGTAISYSTFFGTQPGCLGQFHSAFCAGITVDDNGSIYVTGTTNQLPTGTTTNGFQPGEGEGDDAFVAKFAGTAPIQLTFFYEATPQSGTHGPFADTVTLQDRFLTQDVKVKYGTDFGIPIEAAVSGESGFDILPEVDPNAHFVNYRITATTATPLITATDDVLEVSDIPPLQLLLHDGITLMVPAFERSPRIDPTIPPLTGRQHYRCYDVNAALPANSGTIDGNGQFINTPEVFTNRNEFIPASNSPTFTSTDLSLTKPKMYCVAVKVSNDDGIYDSDITSTSNNYACYEAQRVLGPSAPQTTVRTLEQFGPSVFKTVNNNLLCVPSTIVPNEGPG